MEDKKVLVVGPTHKVTESLGGVMIYDASPRAKDLVDGLFVYHKPEGDQVLRYSELRAKARELVDLILKYTPESPEQTLAIRAIHQGSMQANAAIACNEKWANPDEL
jgi:hypothetical protein